MIIRGVEGKGYHYVLNFYLTFMGPVWKNGEYEKICWKIYNWLIYYYSILIHLIKTPTPFCKSCASNSSKMFSPLQCEKKFFSSMLKIKLAMCTKKEKTIKAYGTENSLRFFFSGSAQDIIK